MIHSIRAMPLSAPFPADVPAHCFRPAAHFHGLPRRGQDAVFVRVESSDGTIGWGEAWGLPIPLAAASCVNDWLAAAWVGREESDHEAIWQMVAAHLHRLGHAEGCGFDALSGIDLAIADLRSRQTDQPLATWLGGTPCAVSCYAAPVPLLPTISNTVVAAQNLINAGHSGIKIKIGRGPDRDAADISAVRSAVGASIDVLVDANGAYDVSTAVTVANKLRKNNVVWFEDPLASDDPRAWQQLRSAGGIPLATGEHLHTIQAFMPWIDVADMLVVNLGRIGGLTGLASLRDRLHGSSTALSFHGVGTALLQSATVHAASAWFPDARMEWNIFPNDLRNSVMHGLPRREGDRIYAPPGPGVGSQVDLQACDYFRTNYAAHA